MAAPMKTALVTGANSGIGLETARGLAQRGYRVLLLCRNAERAATAKADGFLLGLPLTAARMKAPTASRHLVTAHLSAIIQGATLLALSGVMSFSDLPNVIETIAAAMLVSGAMLFVAGAVTNWRQDVEDHFAVRSAGWRLFAASGPANVAGAAIVVVGVLRGL